MTVSHGFPAATFCEYILAFCWLHSSLFSSLQLLACSLGLSVLLLYFFGAFKESWQLGWSSFYGSSICCGGSSNIHMSRGKQCLPCVCWQTGNNSSRILPFLLPCWNPKHRLKGYMLSTFPRLSRLRNMETPSSSTFPSAKSIPF